MNLSNPAVNNEVAILNRIIAPEVEDLSPEVARYILSLDFQQTDRDRIRALAAKARTGELTPSEQHEIESYERIGHLVALLRFKARRSLNTSQSDL